jgi:hypothetical protein
MAVRGLRAIADIGEALIGLVQVGNPDVGVASAARDEGDLAAVRRPCG